MKSRLAATIKLLNKTEKEAYKTLTISLFAVSFLSVFALRPSIRVIASYRKNLDTATEVNQQLTTKITNLEKAKQNLARYDIEIHKLNTALPAEFNQSDLLKGLSFLAAKNKITILKTEFSVSEREGLLETVKISLDARGTLDNIYSFLQNLEQEPRYIRINSVILQTAQTVVTAKISAKVFYTNDAKR
ncbi:MAG: type 4a pilus biogenesis protein PilO [Patescibacteria group bacterium]|nr:type 4a pilus biogenesis protein PilO [Patescibacteria group bacterium]